MTSSEPTNAKRGGTVAVLAGKGGAGKTMLAINLAVALGGGGAQRVCLVDLNLVTGDVARALRMHPHRTFIDAPGEFGKTDSDVGAIVTAISPGFDCVLAPAGPGEAKRVTPQLIGDVLAALADRYDYVVVDTPLHMPAHVLVALDVADHHLLVAVPELPSLQRLRETLDVLDLLGYSRHARSIVVNRTDAQVVLSAHDVEGLIHAPIDNHIPFSWDVPASVNHGVPISVAHPHHPVSAAIRELALTRISAPASPGRRPAETPRSGHGWSP